MKKTISREFSLLFSHKESMDIKERFLNSQFVRLLVYFNGSKWTRPTTRNEIDWAKEWAKKGWLYEDNIFKNDYLDIEICQYMISEKGKELWENEKALKELARLSQE
jgi:hypothetical protein